MKLDSSKSYFVVSVDGMRLVMGVPKPRREGFLKFVTDAIQESGDPNFCDFEALSDDDARIGQACRHAEYDGDARITEGKDSCVKFLLQMRPLDEPNAPSRSVYRIYWLLGEHEQKLSAAAKA